jgi:ActD protein
MSRRLLYGTFRDEASILAATRAVRAQGYEIVDVYTPYAVHGLDQAMGLRRSRLGLACFALGALGLGCTLAFEYWTSAVSWPLNVGGKPWNSWPAFIPVAFELTVLCAGLGTVLAFLLRSRLFPGRHPVLATARVTDDEFVLVLVETSAAFDPERVRALLAPLGPVRVEERIEEAP